VPHVRSLGLLDGSIASDDCGNPTIKRAVDIAKARNFWDLFMSENFKFLEILNRAIHSNHRGG
jgi:hypothetical protein